MHHHVVGVDGAGPGLVADAQRIEGVEGVGAELDAGTDLADLGRLLEHLHMETLPRQGEGGGEAADAAAGDQHGKFSCRIVHCVSCC